MPNNEFDKVLGDKLEGYETSFNPSDWQNMEAMLPRNSKKFFLVMVAMFVLLFLGTGALMVNNLLNSNGKEKISAIAMTGKGKELEQGYGGLKYNQDKTNAAGLQQSRAKQPAGNEDTPESKAVSNQFEVKDRIAINDKTGFGKATTSNSKEDMRSGKSHSNGKMIGGGERETRKKEGATRNQKPPSKKESTPNKNARDIPMPVSHRMNNPSYAPGESAEMLARKNAGLITKDVSADPQIPSLEAMESVWKKKRKIFQFTFGIGTGMNLSFIDANYFTKPGYSTGISQELMFVRRVGLILSESYVYRKYDGGQYPCAEAGYECPETYSSDVQSIDFGVDVKAIIIRKARWDWYAKAGIVNMVKLKETFDYTFPDADTVSPPPPPPPDLSNNTNFNGTTTDSFEGLGVVNTFSPNYNPPDLTISGVKRYHIAYHFATGFDVNLNSRLKLLLEADYSFTKPTVGEEDKRLHSLGLRGGILCRLGK